MSSPSSLFSELDRSSSRSRSSEKESEFLGGDDAMNSIWHHYIKSKEEEEEEEQEPGGNKVKIHYYSRFKQPLARFPYTGHYTTGEAAHPRELTLVIAMASHYPFIVSLGISLYRSLRWVWVTSRFTLFHAGDGDELRRHEEKKHLRKLQSKRIERNILCGAKSGKVREEMVLGHVFPDCRFSNKRSTFSSQEMKDKFLDDWISLGLTKAASSKYAPLDALWSCLRLMPLGCPSQITLRDESFREHTFLTRAIDEGSIPIVSELIRLGCNLNRSSFAHGENATPLQRACDSGFAPIVKLLLDHGALFSSEKDELYRVCRVGDGDCIRTLISFRNQNNTPHSSSVDHRFASSHGSWSPLETAIAFGRLEAMKALLDCGADINLRNQMGHSPLLWTMYCHPTESGLSDVTEDTVVEMTRLLLRHGAKIDSSVVVGSAPITSLYLALQNNFLKVVEVLVHEGGADVNFTTEATGWTLFHRAALMNHPRVITRLLRIKSSSTGVGNKISSERREAAPPDPARFNRKGLAPIHIAVREGSLAALKALHEVGGVDLNLRTTTTTGSRNVAGAFDRQTTPLLMACECGHVEVVKYLLQQRSSSPSSLIDMVDYQK